MNEDQKLDLILETLEDLQTFVNVLKITGDNYIDAGTAIKDSLERLNAEVDYNTVKKHIDDLAWLFID